MDDLQQRFRILLQRLSDMEGEVYGIDANWNHRDSRIYSNIDIFNVDLSDLI